MITNGLPKTADFIILGAGDQSLLSFANFS
jgi:hypothetical protein